MARAFVIRPFGSKPNSSGQRLVDFERIDRELITPALLAAGLGGGTTGQLVDAGNIREDMFALILEADLVLCDITVHNANVFYELGIRHALRKKHTVMIKGEPVDDRAPFDLSTDRYFAYPIDDPAAALSKLTETLLASLNAVRATDSPIFEMLPGLSEADPSEVTVVPLDFSEEVRRAQSAMAKGWLRLLAEEVQGERFQWEGLRLIAAAQWHVEDYEGARQSWERIREIYPHDVVSNLAVANIYERLYRKAGQSALFECSEQAIERVLGGGLANRQQIAEARALKGRNQKTLWRVELNKLASAEQRRKAALNRTLIKSYEAYRDAYFDDLNHFYPGLNALQMGTILLEFAASETWVDLFESDEDADRYHRELEKVVTSLRYLVSTAVATALRRMDDDDPERVWAEISNADVLFLTDEKREGRVISAYRYSIPIDNPFAWDAVRGQLQLFSDLGIQSALAENVIKELAGAFTNAATAKPIHLVIFAGHSIDLPGRAEPRFPEDKEAEAKTLIRAAIAALRSDEFEIALLASAAPGADILAHESCAELGLRGVMCLPMPAEAIVRLAYQGLDDWRTRFLNLWAVQKRNDGNLILSDRDGLPPWLLRSGVNAWERGNEWVMQMALTWGAKRLTLVTFWDGKREGDAPGGTAHMVRLAEDTGQVHIVRIDSTRLLSPRSVSGFGDGAIAG